MVDECLTAKAMNHPVRLGELVQGTWLEKRSTSPGGYLRVNGCGFIDDVAAITGLSRESVVHEARALQSTQNKFGFQIAVHHWPKDGSVTSFYRVLYNDEIEHMLDRWVGRLEDVAHGVTEGLGPVVLTAHSYATILGNYGKAVASLLLARDRGILAEVDIFDSYYAGIGPGYVLPEHAALFGRTSAQTSNRAVLPVPASR